MADSKGNICLPLPGSITHRISTCANTEQYVTNLLQNLLPPSDTSTIADELRKGILLGKHKSKQRRKRRHRGKLLTSKKRTELGLRTVGCKHGMKYTDLLPLNKLWLDYMRQMLGENVFHNMPTDSLDSNWEGVNQQLIKADYHGAEISVARSKCPSLIGLGGIIIQDTKNAFRICGKDDIIRTIPKDVVVFNFYMGKTKLELFGKELSIRPSERTVKKFKTARALQL